ncbi:MAG TPA: cache domain-containing protein [Candidatus Baltobacteraceae bacterium]|nr:cache domain-containing protein [Candidatus Baltobacteraceae bacterium]
MSLRVRLLGTIIGAIIVFFIISVVAARLTLSRDLTDMGKSQVSSGSSAFNGYWDGRKDQVRLLIAQDAVSDALRKNLQAGNASALQDQLSNIARTSGLSFLTIVDNKGKVIARANGAAPGSLSGNKYVQRALEGETVSSAALVPANDLAGEGLAAQVTTDVKDASGKTAETVKNGLAIIAAAPMSDASERTLGAIYGGVLMNHYYDLVDSSTTALGGSVAILDGDAIVSGTISEKDQTRHIDAQVPAYNAQKVSTGTDYVGSDDEGGTEYLARISPIRDDQNNVIGALWYGTPMSQITTIINHMTQTFVLWGLLAMVLALAIAVPIVERVSNALAKRSEQVSAAAKELGVAIVGGEVSGDHVAATRSAVERAGQLISELGENASPKVAELKAVNEELHGDIIVIDTLSQEMSNRLQQAVTRVAELNDVASGLDKLVHGAAAK